MNDNNTKSVFEHDETVGAVFDVAIHAERRSEEFYRMMADGFSHVPGLSAFWKGLMKDEVGHARALERIRESLAADQLMLRAEDTLLEKARGTQRFLRGKCVQEIRTLNDAYQTAHELEHCELNALFVLLAFRFVSEEDRKTFLRSEIQRHQAKLTAFPHTFGGLNWRQSISIENPVTVEKGIVPFAAISRTSDFI